MKRATYEDVLNAPENKVAEILDGELFLSPRPAPRHAAVLVAARDGASGPLRPRHRRARRLVDPRRARAPLRRARSWCRTLPGGDASGCPAHAGRGLLLARARLGVRGALALHRAHRSRPQAAGSTPRPASRTRGSSSPRIARSRCCGFATAPGRSSACGSDSDRAVEPFEAIELELGRLWAESPSAPQRP